MESRGGIDALDDAAIRQVSWLRMLSLCLLFAAGGDAHMCCRKAAATQREPNSHDCCPQYVSQPHARATKNCNSREILLHEAIANAPRLLRETCRSDYGGHRQVAPGIQNPHTARERPLRGAMTGIDAYADSIG